MSAKQRSLRIVGSEPTASPPAGFTWDDQVKCKGKECKQPFWVAPEHRQHREVECPHCQHKQSPGTHRQVRNWISRKLTWAALVAWPFAIFAPIVSVESIVESSSQSIYSGTKRLFEEGDWVVGALVGGFSLVGPIIKILLMLVLTSNLGEHHGKHNAPVVDFLKRALEWLGRMGMLDVFAIAATIVFFKMGKMLDVQKGLGFWAFLLMTALILASGFLYKPAKHEHGNS